MITLVKAILSDTLFFVIKILNYIYWNFKGVRITFSCNVSIKAKIDKGVVFTGNTVITENSKIGAFTYGHNVNINNAIIGQYCSIAPGVKIGLDEHDISNFSTHPSTYNSKQYMAKVGKANIGNHVWIGANAVILAGKSIGSHSVVAAGAVVTKDIPEYELWVGVPAKSIKKLILTKQE